MKSHITLCSIVSLLFFNNVYAESTDVSACNKAIANDDAAAAITQANKALSRDKTDKDALVCLGRGLSAKGDLEAALATFKLADAQSKDLFDKTIIALVTGHAYQTAKQYEQAITNYRQSFSYAQASKNHGFERITQNLIGDVYAENKQFEQALASYLIGSNLAANDNERGDSYEKVALTYHKLVQHDASIEYQIKAYLMYGRAGTLDQYARSAIDLGRYYIAAKNYAGAENTLNKIISFAKEQGGAYYEAQGSYLLAKVKAASGDVATARTLLETAKTIAKSTQDQALTQEIEQETRQLF